MYFVSIQISVRKYLCVGIYLNILIACYFVSFYRVGWNIGHSQHTIFALYWLQWIFISRRFLPTQKQSFSVAFLHVIASLSLRISISGFSWCLIPTLHWIYSSRPDSSLYILSILRIRSIISSFYWLDSSHWSWATFCSVFWRRVVVC